MMYYSVICKKMLALLISFIFFASFSSSVLAASSSSSSKIVLGFTTYYYSGDVTSYNSEVNNKSVLNQIATATYSVNGTGKISGVTPQNQINFANANNIKPLLLLTNNFNAASSKALLQNPSNVNNAIANLKTILKQSNYKGVNIDFEALSASDRNYYSQFIKKVYIALHDLGYTVSVSLPAKTSDNPKEYWTYAYDYINIGNYVDYAVIMTYDEHYSTSSPGPVASINWVKAVVNYTTKVIPKNRVVLGLADYGYDWTNNSQTPATAYGINKCYSIAAKYNAKINWDPIAMCCYFNYTDANNKAHTVYFEDSSSISYKLNLVNSKGLKGIAIWKLGLDNSAYWKTIHSIL